MTIFHPEDLIIIDIETAPLAPDFSNLSSAWQDLWEEKTQYTLPATLSPAAFYPRRAGVMAEFARIVCISIGYFSNEYKLRLHLRSFFGFDEKYILQCFLDTLQKINQRHPGWCFAGHNIKEFDIPFICRRLLINQFELPAFLDFQNKKPWETNIVDSFQYWRFGDYKHYTSLKLLAAVMGIPSPKDDIDGSMVGELFWTGDEEQRVKNMHRIVKYCEKDILTTANILLRFRNMDVLGWEDVERG
jgi:uncharacterized protein YprB with RNaseH-like and TPR domain